MANSPTNLRAPRLRAARIIAAAMLATPIVLAALATYLVQSGVIAPEESSDAVRAAKTIQVALTLVGITFALASFPLRRLMDGQTPPGAAGAGQRFRNMIIAMALCENAGVLGFIAAMVTGSLAYALVLWVLAIAGCMLHFPTQSSLGGRGSRPD